MRCHNKLGDVVCNRRGRICAVDSSSSYSITSDPIGSIVIAVHLHSSHQQSSLLSKRLLVSMGCKFPGGSFDPTPSPNYVVDTVRHLRGIRQTVKHAVTPFVDDEGVRKYIRSHGVPSRSFAEVCCGPKSLLCTSAPWAEGCNMVRVTGEDDLLTESGW